jgi:hypothetical protein
MPDLIRHPGFILYLDWIPASAGMTTSSQENSRHLIDLVDSEEKKLDHAEI